VKLHLPGEHKPERRLCIRYGAGPLTFTACSPLDLAAALWQGRHELGELPWAWPVRVLTHEGPDGWLVLGWVAPRTPWDDIDERCATWWALATTAVALTGQAAFKETSWTD
jgi:hypothetical protein